MRMLVIKQDTDVAALSGRLLSARLNADQADAALASLQTLNPHVDLKNLRSGTVLVVPDAPSFKVSATDSFLGEVLDPLERVMKSALDDAAVKLKAGHDTRSAERAEVAKALRTTAFKRVVETDPELKQQVASAGEALKKEQAEAEQAEQAVAAAGKAALAALAALGKLLG